MLSLWCANSIDNENEDSNKKELMCVIFHTQKHSPLYGVVDIAKHAHMYIYTCIHLCIHILRSIDMQDLH